VHPVGTVIGRASFEEQLVIYQNVTIGGKHSSKAISYPKLDRNVIIYSNSSIIGNCDVGENVIIGAQALIVDKIVPSNSIVLGQHPKCRVLTNQANNNFFF
jgi:serine O-acetyltransferase